MTMPIKVAGAWGKVTAIPVKVAGVWRSVQNGYVKVSGSWRLFFTALKSLKFVGHSNGPDSANNFHYDLLSNKSITLVSGDKLIYDVYATGPEFQTGIDTAIYDGNTFYQNLRDVERVLSVPIRDQYGQTPHPGGSGSNYFSLNKWYTRIFDLSPLAGKTCNTWACVFEGNITGDYVSYFRNIRIVGSNGITKLSIFLDTVEVPNSTVWSGTSNNYQNTGKSVVNGPV